MINYLTKQTPRNNFKFPLRNFDKIIPALTLLVAAFVVFVSGQGEACAGVKSPVDYCYQREIAVTYTGAGTLTNTAVRIPTDSAALVAGGYVDNNIWEIFSVQGSLSNETNILAQDITSVTAPYWYMLSSISPSTTATIRLYMQNPEQQRDQGILFTGNDELSASHAPALNITNNLDIQLDLDLLSVDPQTGTLISHYDTAATQGYKVTLEDVGSALKLRATIENHDCDLTINPAWLNEPDRYNITFNTGNLQILRNDVSLQTCLIGAASITAVTEPLVVGTDLNNLVIRNINLFNGSSVAARYSFAPNSLTETSAADPVYQGTIQDLGVNNLDFLYTFNRPQSNFTVTASAIVPVGTASIIPMPDTTVDVLGSPFGGSISTPVPSGSTGLFYDLIARPMVTGTNAIDAPTGMVYSIILGSLGLVIAVFVYMKTSFIPMALFTAGIPPAVGAINGWLPYWWIIFWALLVVLSWFALRGADT